MKYIIIAIIIFLIIFIYASIKVSSLSDNDMLEQENKDKKETI